MVTQSQQAKEVKAKNPKADSTLRTSQAVPHPSTIRALSCLTLEVKRDPVHSTRYGRQQRRMRNYQRVMNERNSLSAIRWMQIFMGV